VRGWVGVGENIACRTLFDDHAVIKKQHPVGDLAGKTHLVRHHHHGHAVLGQRAHHAQHLADQFRVEGRCRLVDRMACGCMASARAIATRCCAARQLRVDIAASFAASPTRASSVRRASIAVRAWLALHEQRSFDHVFQRGPVWGTD